LDELAGSTHGFVGADLQALCKEAAMKVLRRLLPEINLEAEQIPQEVLDKLRVSRNDFFEAMKEIQPSALREVYIEVPNVKWEEIGGMLDIKRELNEAVELPLKHPEKFTKLGIRPVKGILLYGPPGCGKTLFAKAVATESEANFISIKGPEIISKWVGESEKAVREIFRKARQASPAIIFIDEVDAIASQRGMPTSTHASEERVVNQLLTELDGVENLKDVVVIGATNRPDIIDPAILRSGRFDKLIQIPLPDEATRLEILKVHSKKMPLEPAFKLEEFAKQTDGFSGADLEGLCREAGMFALRENADKISLKHFRESLKTLRAPVTKKKEAEDKRQHLPGYS
jgi:transitional endoplasmic reticulum ATPase